MSLKSKHISIKIIALTVFLLFIFSGIISQDIDYYELLNENPSHYDYTTKKEESFFLPLLIILLAIFILGSVVYTVVSPFVSLNTKWINPILELSAELMKIDGNVSKNELARVKRYLEREFTPKVAKNKYAYLLEVLKRKNNTKTICNDLNETHVLEEKNEIIEFLIKIVISDKFLSKSEEQFIEIIGNWLEISPAKIQGIYLRNKFVREENLNNSQSVSPKSDYKLKRAYNSLGLNEDATEEEVKKSFRSLMKLYHPDKLVNKGLSKFAIENTKKKYQEVQDAYELLKLY